MNFFKYKKARLFIMTMLCIIVLLGITYLSSKLPMQNLKITASTTADEFDISGKTDIYYFMPLNTGKTYKAVIKFMAVKNTSQNLFTSYGTGQYVYLGCSEMRAECSFIAIDKFLHVRLTLNAAQTDLKLEDGTPFDNTRYSLKPVLVIEE